MTCGSCREDFTVEGFFDHECHWLCHAEAAESYDHGYADALTRAPRWCFSPTLRGFVMGNALAAPILVLLYALGRAS